MRSHSKAVPSYRAARVTSLKSPILTFSPFLTICAEMVTLAAQFYLRDKPFQYLTVLSDIGAALGELSCPLCLLLPLL